MSELKHDVEGQAGHELEDQPGLDSSLEDEQQQHLLPGHSDEKATGSGPKLAAKRLWLTVATAGLLLLLAALALARHDSQEAAQDFEDALAVQMPSYMLRKDWDTSAPPQRREYAWTIRDRLHNPDGIYRPMILVNNMFPGPLIEANEGDTIVVHVDNRAVNATSIHWHGLYQNGTPHMDGTVGITQCPIAPGSQFTYEFNVTGQHGTYWWHGHQGVQTSDGLHGPLIIHGRQEQHLQTLEYDSDQVVLLSDHYHDLSSALMFQYLMPDNENTEPVPQSALINGQGLRSCDHFTARQCDSKTANVAHPVFNLEQGKRHRLRLVNVGAFAEFQFQIDEHQLAVTEVDGTDVYPETYHRLNINTAQRYSIIVNASATAIGPFWMRARMITHCFTDPPDTLDPDALAIVQYGEMLPAVSPTSQDWGEKLDLECKDMNTTALEPVEIRAPPSEPDAVFYLRTNFEIGAYRLSRGFFNSSSWRADVTSPSLLRAAGAVSVENDSFRVTRRDRSAFVNHEAFHAERELVIQSNGIQTIDLLVSNFDDGNHPLHLHGYKFFVLAQGHGAPPLTRLDAAIDRQSLAPLYSGLNITNPLRRDTASVEAFGWILLRVVADNPGMWAFHCHVSWHAEAGLLMQLLTRADGLANITIPQASRDLCNAQGLEKGMAPADSVYEDFAK